MKKEKTKKCDHDYKETETGLYCFRCGKWKNKPQWEEELHIAMEEVRPADWYYDFIRQLLQAEREKIIKEIERMKIWSKGTPEGTRQDIMAKLRLIITKS